MKFFKYCILKVKVDSTKMRIVFSFTRFLDINHKKSTQLAHKKGQLDTMTYVYIC